MPKRAVSSEPALAERRRRRKHLQLERESDREYVESGRRMFAIREALGMNQRDFAYYLRVSINTVSNWENGKTLPSGLAEQAIRQVAVDHGVDLHTLGRFDG